MAKKDKKPESHGKEKPREHRIVENAKDVKEDIRYIVRIASKDLNGRLPVYHALQGIRGIGHRVGMVMAKTFARETGIAFDSLMGKLPEEKDPMLEDIVSNPGKHGIPAWMFNRRKDVYTGRDLHNVMADMDFALRTDLQRMSEVKSYKGLRHSWGLTVRGQRTRSTHRGKGGVVGVLKKEAKAAAVAAASKKEEPAKKKG